MRNREEVDLIKKAIAVFMMREFNETVSMNDIDNEYVEIAYTTLEDHDGIGIQVAVDIENLQIDQQINGYIAKSWQYDNAMALSMEIMHTSFEDFVSLDFEGTECIEKYVFKEVN